jgi:mRNA interferase RelE/StbE
MQYKVRLTRQARKDLTALPQHVYRWVVETIDQLSIEPRPPSSKKLKGGDGYSIRRGDYRIVYDIEDELLLVVVIRAAHRKDVYRAL